MMRPIALALTTLLGLLVSSAAVELTVDNFDELTIGKTVFLKFYDPMCVKDSDFAFVRVIHTPPITNYSISLFR